MIEQIEQRLAELDKQDLLRHRRVTATPCAAVMNVDGRTMLAFCSNDYLGLAAHPQIQHALQEGVTLYGAGSGASHLISGHSKAHAQLEERLAAMQSPYLEQARALYLSTGYMANLAVLSGLAATDPGQAEIFSENLNHASLIDGAKLARCKVQVYPHADLIALENLLQQSGASTKIVVTDSVFSMDGVIAPLPEILALCERYNAWLVIDDAHGFGVLGDGAGILSHFNLRSKNIVYMGTLGKAAGVSGAFIAAHGSVIEWLVQKARPYIYTTAAPPALAHALLTSLDIICGAEGAQRRTHLQGLIKQFKTAIGSEVGGMSLLASDTQIQPLIVGENHLAMQLAARLYERGIWVPAIRPPTVPVGTARLRVTLSAAHSSAQVATLLSELDGLQKKAA
ncbi:8-amino-7-oxononanoate synthase [Solimicrobium silvestre]|uniref:8-amino-7-oxononanoate synthase n=1 Tax=Solimicrobium silvestre TaxID=2099400 RepID=A0A2S9H055_9BURK|nr:8-amino-7-oxononanoate synthase [Solimicrobium silvestre]PRC93333.1 bioF: 8-amino-7-oxononanoate synthase [Solimicrobium silvestre]